MGVERPRLGLDEQDLTDDVLRLNDALADDNDSGLLTYFLTFIFLTQKKEQLSKKKKNLLSPPSDGARNDKGVTLPLFLDAI